MADATFIAAMVSAEEAAKLTEGLSEGEQSAVSLICLTENLVDTVSDIIDRLTGGPQLSGVFEQMIRQLGQAAVAGCREHYGLTEEQIVNCCSVAENVTTTIMTAAQQAAIKNELEKSNATAKH